MTTKNKNDDFFKNIASLYVEQDGKRLMEELQTLKKDTNPRTTPRIDQTIAKALQKNNRQRFYWVSAACIIIIVFSINFLFFLKKPMNSNTATKPTTQDVIQLSTKLPTGYAIQNIDYDQGKTIYFIDNDTNNSIVLTVEKENAPIDTSGMQSMDVNGNTVYTLRKKDYKFITFEKDQMVYTLTSKYQYQDLLTISQNIL